MDDPAIQDSEPDFQSQHWNNTAQTNIGVSFGDPMEHERIDESRCYVCGSEEGCALCMQTRYRLCSQCRISNPKQGWWDSNEDLHLDSAHGSSVDAEVFEADGAETLSEVSSAKVHDILMSNPDHTMPAKRGNNVVSINSMTGHFKYEPFGVRKLADKNRKRVKTEANNRQDLTGAAEKSRKITSMFQPLFQDTEEENDCHQPLKGGYMVKREPVALKLEEEQWLRLEWGLRSCHTWNDGYSMYRCASAANRKSTKQEMVADLLLFWGCAYKLSKQYIYVGEDRTDCEEEFTETLAQKNREALQLVQESLDRGVKDRLN
jgi:hypothetical protein